MKKNVSIFFCTLFLLSSAFLMTLASYVPPVRATPHSLTVDDDGPADFHTIQEAVNAAEEGDAIFVYNGTYYENVVIDKSVLLFGEHKNKTIIDGSQTGTVVYVSGKNVTITGFTARNSGDYPHIGIDLKESHNSNITDNIINNSSEGILLYNSTNTFVQHNTIAYNYGGVRLSGGSHMNIITHNTIMCNLWGINLDNSSDNILVGNTLRNNSWTGIDLFQSKCENNMISDNIITSNGNGIRSYNRASGNTIKNNTITYNNDTAGGRGRGISLSDHSRNYKITANTITENRYGLHLFITEDNTFFHNNFISNAKHVYQTVGNYTNSWDNGLEGNYWSNYTGLDPDHDAIGDSLYEIDEYNKDRYPLMGIFSDFSATSEYHVYTICNSTISDFQFNGTAISFDATGKDGTPGFCRIFIPTALVNGTYKVFVNGTEIPHTLLPSSNSTCSYLYFTYQHSTQKVIIIPEFPFLLLLPLFMMSTLLATIFYRTITISNKTKQTKIRRSIFQLCAI